LFSGLDNTGNGIADDTELVMLQYILNGDACTRQLLGGAKCDDIVAAFNNNRTLIGQKETGLDFSITNTSRVSARYDTGVIGVISFNNRPAWMAQTHIVTGAPATLPITVDTDVTFVGTSNLGAILGAVGIPSLWGSGGILSSASAGFGEDFQTLMAAYMTIGDQNALDYMTCVMAQALVKGVLPNIVALLLNNLKAGSGLPEGEDPLPPKDDGEKLYTVPAIANIMVDNTTPQTIDLGDGNWVRIDALHAIEYGTTIQAGLTSWFQTYVVGGVQGTGTYASRTTLLAASGNLNGIGNTNLVNYNLHAQNRALYLNSEWVTYPTLSFAVPPQSTSTAQPYGGTWNFGAALASMAANVTAPTYVWQWNNAGTWTTITGATTLGYILPLDFVGTQQYRVIATPPANCGSAVTSAVASVQVSAPTVTISQQPNNQTAAYGSSASFTCVAGPPTILYQWYNSGGIITGATSSVYTIPSVTYANGTASPYYCICRLQSYPSASATSNNVTLTVTAPPIVFTLQPVGASVQAGNNYSMTCTATIALGNLTYLWYKGGVSTGVTGTTYNITGMDASKAGLYFCRVTARRRAANTPPSRLTPTRPTLNCWARRGALTRTPLPAPVTV